MKRKGLLALTGCDPKRFEVLQARDQLPIVNLGRWTDYTLRDALAVRLTLDLIGGEGDEPDKLGGVPPAYAHKVVSNGLRYARDFETLGGLISGRVLLGGAIFQSHTEDLRFSRWFAGPVESLGPWLAEIGREENAAPVRIMLVNAGRAANEICLAAAELGIAGDPGREPL
ncbi:MAG: hypothetical protein D6754_16555 [Alphaproteobacteria bacterium]|nr:MAG: hypothetical protein D6754_16555 [Alphaproteobacteria bacterium]